MTFWQFADAHFQDLSLLGVIALGFTFLLAIKYWDTH